MGLNLFNREAKKRTVEISASLTELENQLLGTLDEIDKGLNIPLDKRILKKVLRELGFDWHESYILSKGFEVKHYNLETMKKMITTNVEAFFLYFHDYCIKHSLKLKDRDDSFFSVDGFYFTDKLSIRETDDDMTYTMYAIMYEDRTVLLIESCLDTSDGILLSGKYETRISFSDKYDARLMYLILETCINKMRKFLFDYPLKKE